MKRQLLLIISSNPRTSARPSEALRIAAGVIPWGEVRVQICFCNEGVMALDEVSGDWPGGEIFERYLPALVQHGLPPWVEETSTSLKEIKNPIVNFERVSTHALAEFASSCDCTLNF